MLLLTLAVTLSLSLALGCPRTQTHNCTCVASDEREVYCPVGSAGDKVTYRARNNEYVNIECEGTKFTCADLPVINFANGMALPSLSIENCAPSILECLPEALQMTSVSKYLTVMDGTAPLTGEHVAGLGDITNLVITRGPEKKIPISVVHALPSLRILRITGTEVALESNVFANATQIKFLELGERYGRIEEIPEDAFNGLTNLETLNMWGNDIKEIGVNSFRGLDSVESLALMTCHIRSMAAGSLAHLPKLRSIWLFVNSIKELPRAFMSNLTQLENITIQSNEVPLKLQNHSFSNLPLLKNLIINDSDANLPEYLLTGCDALQTIDFSKNKITSLPFNVFKDLKNLERLDLSFNQIATLSSRVFSPLKKLQYLNLNRNHLEVLPNYLFSGLTRLNYVSMDENLLTTISPFAFQGAINLQNVSLKNNRLTLEQEGYHRLEMYSPFNLLAELKNLYLSGNQIGRIFNDWQIVLLKLQSLDLSGNNFTVLDATECQFLSENLVVDLQNNAISSIMMTYATLYKGDEGYTESTNTVLLDNNPLECDCGLYNLAMRVRGAKPFNVEPNFVVGNATCASPTNLKGKLFVNVSSNDLICDLPVEKCHNSCTACELRPATNDLAYTCDAVPPVMASPEPLGVEYLSLTLKTAPMTLDNLNLRLLNLSNIGLDDIPFSPSNTVKDIDFSNNLLSSIPIEFLNTNVTLYLSNNPFTCDCWHSKELAMLKNSSRVMDLALIKCGDKFLSKIDPSELCNNWRAAAVASGTFIALVIIVAIIAIIVYKNLHKIIAFIIKYGLCPGCFVENIDDVDKEYDVFISYAHKDRHHLEKLMPKLEQDFGLKTCVHYRDWFVGDFIPDQINRSVEKSRKTIILLSNNFLDSAYANMEFRAAHNLALKEGKNRIILILLEDVTTHEKLSEELRAHMKMNTYLKWEDSGFYEKLQRAMPLIDNKKFVWPDVFKQATEKTVKGGLDVHLNSNGQLVNIGMKDPV